MFIVDEIKNYDWSKIKLYSEPVTNTSKIAFISKHGNVVLLLIKLFRFIKEKQLIETKGETIIEICSDSSELFLELSKAIKGDLVINNKKSIFRNIELNNFFEELSNKDLPEYTEENKYTFEEYSKDAMKTAIYKSLGQNLNYPLLGLGGEIGELLGKISKIERGDYEMTEEFRKECLKECGDILWFLSQTVFELGSTLEEVAKNNIKKLSERMKKGTIMGNGDNR